MHEHTYISNIHEHIYISYIHQHLYVYLVIPHTTTYYIYTNIYMHICVQHIHTNLSKVIPDDITFDKRRVREEKSQLAHFARVLFLLHYCACVSSPPQRLRHGPFIHTQNIYERFCPAFFSCDTSVRVCTSLHIACDMTHSYTTPET